MTSPPDACRVLRVYHSSVVREYRERDRLLRSAHGYDLHLVSPPAWSEGGLRVTSAPDDAVPMHVVPTRGREHPILFWYATRQFRRVLREVRPDIVDLHEEPYSLSVAAALHAVEREAPDAKVCVYTAQNIYKRYPPPFRQLEHRALNRATAAYPCSSGAADVLRSKGFRGQIHVLPLGVSLQRRSPRAFKADGLRVGFLGRLESYKGGDFAIRAFAAAATDLDATLEVVGAGSEREALATRAAELGVADRVVFMGAVPQDDALARLATYDAVLVPSVQTRSWKEQFGRIPAQAMEAGSPVIAFDSGSLREVVADAGELVPEGDLDALSGRLRAVLSDPRHRADLSKRGRERAGGLFSWERVAEGFDVMYRQALDRS